MLLKNDTEHTKTHIINATKMCVFFFSLVIELCLEFHWFFCNILRQWFAWPPRNKMTWDSEILDNIAGKKTSRLFNENCYGEPPTRKYKTRKKIHWSITKIRVAVNWRVTRKKKKTHIHRPSWELIFANFDKVVQKCCIH